MKEAKLAIPFLEGNYDHYFRAVAAVGMTAVQVRSADEALRCDGLLLPGGADINPQRYGEECDGSLGIDDALDELQFSVMREFSREGRPVLGICRGHQIVNVFFGGSLYQNLDAADSHSRRNGEEQFHKVNIKENSILFAKYGMKTVVNSSHHQGIKKPGKGLAIIAEADDGTVEAIVHETLPIIGLQWHPERMLNAAPGRADGKLALEIYREMLKI